MSVLTVTTVAALVDPPFPLTATLTFDTEDSLAMTLTVRHDLDEVEGKELAEEITWHFARQLLNAALADPGVMYGWGDVQIQVLDGALYFNVIGAAGIAHPIIVELEPARNFLIRTYLHVPAYMETADVDGAIAQIVGESA